MPAEKEEKKERQIPSKPLRSEKIEGRQGEEASKRGAKISIRARL